MSFNRRQFVAKGTFAAAVALFPSASLIAGEAPSGRPEDEVLKLVSSYGSQVRLSGRDSKSVSIVAKISDINRMRYELGGAKFGKLFVKGNTVSFTHRDVRFNIENLV